MRNGFSGNSGGLALQGADGGVFAGAAVQDIIVSIPIPAINTAGIALSPSQQMAMFATAQSGVGGGGGEGNSNFGNNGKWPTNPGKGNYGKVKSEMDKKLGVEGKWIPDGKSTMGRKAVEWELPDGTKIKWEGHPYDAGKFNNPTHIDRHWHIKNPGDTDYGPGFQGNISLDDF